MKRSPITWIVLGVAVLLAVAWIVRPTTLPAPPGTHGDEPSRGRNASPGGPAPAPAPGLPPGLVPKEDDRPAGEGSLAGDGTDLDRVTDLMKRFEINPSALHHAFRAGWQAAEFRRLTRGNELARAAYLEALNDRERLHLELEFGVTNTAFYQQLFSLDIRTQPKTGRPELLAPTPEGQFVYEYNRRIQGGTEALQRVAGILRDHGLEGFPLVLRAGEDLALLGFCEQRHEAIESARIDWMKEPETGPDTRTQFQADIAASRAGIDAFRNVLEASFEQIAGVTDPTLFADLHAVATGPTILPVRPPPDAQERLRLIDEPVPRPGPTGPPQ